MHEYTMLILLTIAHLPTYLWLNELNMLPTRKHIILTIPN